MKKRPCLLFIFTTIAFFAVGPVIAQADTMQSCRYALDALYAPNAAMRCVSFGNFTYASSGAGTDFSRYLMEQFETAMTNLPQYTLFKREKLDEILKAQELNLSDVMSGKGVRVGMLENFNAIISGTFWDSGDKVEVFLDLTDIERGTLLNKLSFNISINDLPAGLRVKPENTFSPQAQGLAKVLDTTTGNLRVSVWPDRGDGGTYYDGETLSFSVSANRDCYIKVYFVDVDGNLQLMFPNKRDSDNFVSAGAPRKIPGAPPKFLIRLHTPFGTEIIKVMASTAQFVFTEPAGDILGDARPELIRKYAVAAEGADYAEAMALYSIIRK